MLILLSPAKSLDYLSPFPVVDHSKPQFLKRTADLIGQLKELSPADLSSLMKISAALAELNMQRYKDWSPRSSTKNARPAVFAFDGDVYKGLDVRSLNGRQVEYLQNNLRILSGLYGVLRPLDLMQPHRLEMGTRLTTEKGRNLYDFWEDAVSENLNDALASHCTKAIVNLASEEYFGVVNKGKLSARIITPVFEDWKNGKYKIISFFAKNARGAMARYAAKHAVENPELLKRCDAGGYQFDAEVSDVDTWRFRRRVEN